MILWGLQSSKYLQVCKFYRQVYDAPTIQEDEAKWMPVLRNIVFFVVLAPYDNEQSDLLERVSTDEKLGKIAESLCVTSFPLSLPRFASSTSALRRLLQLTLIPR